MYTVEREYFTTDEEKKRRHILELSAKKYAGVGATDPSGLPVTLRSVTHLHTARLSGFSFPSCQGLRGGSPAATSFDML